MHTVYMPRKANATVAPSLLTVTILMILWLYTRNTDIFPPDWGMLRRFSLDAFGSFFKHIFDR